MSDGSISLNECIKEVLLSGADNISHVTFFIEHVGIIRIPFDDFVGKTVYHCHLLFHEDFGMMGLLNIVK